LLHCHIKETVCWFGGDGRTIVLIGSRWHGPKAML
jgi:hypothetical protein